jgi:hypothetical protein
MTTCRRVLACSSTVGSRELRHDRTYIDPPEGADSDLPSSAASQRRAVCTPSPYHAEAVLAEVYAEAVEAAVAETELPEETFPAQCP